jgi:hypothetical protein
MSDPPSQVLTSPTPPGARPRIADDLVRFSAFALRRRVHVSTLHRQRQLGNDPMPAWKILGRWYISESEFAAWASRRSGRAEGSGRVAADDL